MALNRFFMNMFAKILINKFCFVWSGSIIEKAHCGEGM